MVARRWLLAAALGLFLGCSDDGEGDDKGTADASTQLDATADGSVAGDADGAGDATSDTTAGPKSPAFAQGCPAAGRALVRQLQSDAERFEGPASLAAKGDWLLANDKAAFVIKAPTENEHTYAYYGGLLVDAVAVDGCSQAAPERFGELPFLIGALDIASIPHSTLRSFRGVSAEVLADGSDGGPAKLRVWGQDDWFWLVELELVKNAFLGGKPKPRSGPLGVKLALDYTLAPDRAALRVDLVAINTEDDAKELNLGAASFMDDSVEQQLWSASTLSLGGMKLATGLPWVAGSAAEGAVVIAVDASNLATAHFAGVDALLPVDQLAEPLRLGPEGDPAGDSDMRTFWIGVGRGDSDTAVATLEGLTIGGKSWTGRDISGVVREKGEAAGGGAGIADARVVVERKRNDGSFALLLTTRTASDGSYTLRLPLVGKDGDLRLRAVAPGRALAEPILPPAGEGAASGVDLLLGPAGALGHEVKDEQGKAIPARLTLYDAKGGETGLYFATGGQGSVPVPPGDYTLVVTRGYHHRPWSGPVTITPGQTTPIAVTLPRVVDTSGWMAFDGHVHSQPSPDSRVPLQDRYQHAAAEGLEVIVHSEHEIIVDSEPERQASGVAAWVRGVGGQEVTATLPEHTNMVGVAPDPNHRRGAPVKWHGLDLQQIWAAEKARGAGFRALNHPRKGCNWLCVIGWDREKLAPTLQDPTAVGLPAGATLWSWDFEAVELLNGTDTTIFIDPEKPERTGTFEDWLSFWNAGHQIAALGVTDVHGLGSPGAPRTFFRVPKDDLGAFEDAWLVDAVKKGQTQVSAGAFARVEIAGKGPGEVVPQSAAVEGKLTLKLKVVAIPEIDVTRVLVLVNCDTALEIAATDPTGAIKLETTVQVPVADWQGKDAHIVVLAFGKQPMPKGLEPMNAAKVPRVVTNPIVWDGDGDGVFTGPGGKKCDITPGG